jgi:hypothetical protein
METDCIKVTKEINDKLQHLSILGTPCCSLIEIMTGLCGQGKCGRFLLNPMMQSHRNHDWIVWTRKMWKISAATELI